MRGHGTKDSMEGPDFQNGVAWHDNALMTRGFGLQNDMASHLMNDLISPVAAQDFYQFATRHVARDFHAKAKTSSREKRIRIVMFSEASKKYPAVASLMFVRNSSHDSDWVKIS